MYSRHGYGYVVQMTKIEAWQWWLLIMVTTNTIVNLIVFFVGRKFKRVTKPKDK